MAPRNYPREEWIAQLLRLLQTYWAMGFASANPLAIAVVELSPRLLQATVERRLRDQIGATGAGLPGSGPG